MKRIAWLLVVSALLVPGCASTKWARTPVVKQYDFTVALEQRQGKGAVPLQQYAHPGEIKVADLAQLMTDLAYIEKGGMLSNSKQRPVFQQAEIDRISPVLAEALAKADASQQVRFISFNQEQSVVFSTSRKTEGVVFIESGGRLNMAFNYINTNRIPGETSAIYASYAESDPLKIEAADTPLAISVPYAELRLLDSGRQAPMWVVADLGKIRAAGSSEPPPAAEAVPATVPAAAQKTETRVKPAAPAAPTPPPDNVLHQEIKNKLRYLKELLDEGLISEKDYNVKKGQLLDKID
jgi:hypothetical protein